MMNVPVMIWRSWTDNLKYEATFSTEK